MVKHQIISKFKLGYGTTTYEWTAKDPLLAIEDRRPLQAIIQQQINVLPPNPPRALVVEIDHPEFSVRRTTFKNQIVQIQDREVCPGCHTYLDDHTCKLPTFRGYSSDNLLEKSNNQIPDIRYSPEFETKPLSVKINFWQKAFEFFREHRAALILGNWQYGDRPVDYHIEEAFSILNRLSKRDQAIPFDTFDFRRQIAKPPITPGEQKLISQTRWHQRMNHLSLLPEPVYPSNTGRLSLIKEQRRQKAFALRERFITNRPGRPFIFPTYSEWLEIYRFEVTEALRTAARIPLSQLYAKERIAARNLAVQLQELGF